ncbi:glycosyltransferase family 2 protein [Caenimonas aquaedulcis]|uniref:Glycosyltransferase n=1 Tax=Caenimonas aquaedulcis TaxID=2793270 RepID=A0A931H5S7_9BURK|nr:glycosyltransferase [Caenimonas aquaedulcis]
MASAPLVTIIVPSYNQGRFIRETLASCLAQDYRPLEVLVLDGGSKDETVDVLRGFDAPELQWWSEPDRGVVDAVNKGLDRARGDILTIQSSDDVFLPGAVTAAVQALQSHPGCGLVYGDVELIDAQSRQIGVDEQGPFDFAHYLGRLQYIPQPGAFFTREAMQATGRWRPEVSYAADADYWLRIALGFPVAKIDRRLARYRYHDEQRDTQRERIARDWQRAAQDLLDGGRLDARQRRFARMGMHLARHRYAAPHAWGLRTRALYAALLANPAALADPRFPRRDLLPGRDPLWALLSRVKRRLGFKPRMR